MEAKELMIGDWLFYRGQFNAFSFRVEQITKRKVGYHAEPDESRTHYLTLSECQPIPITPEILEKNGWMKTKYAYGRDCMEIHGTDELPEGIDNALSMARWSIDKNFQYHFLDLYMWKGSVMQHDVHYVHQLQHAFKFFGIEKEITIY